MKILIIEDDQILAKNLKQVLANDGFAVDAVNTQEDGLIQTEINEYDCIVLDVNLPDGSGFDLLANLRKTENKTPVIIVTARGQVEDRIKGLNLGADDYVPKPLDSNELTARIRAVIRRNTQNGLPILTIGDLVVKPAEHLAKIAKNVNIKVPITEDGIKTIKALTELDIKTNATLCFSANQAILVAKAGATFVSPFIGRLDDIGHNGMQLVEDTVQIYKNYNFKTEVIVASIRSPLQVANAAKIGAHICTIPPKVIKQLLKHPLTDIGIERFLEDWKKVPK